MTQREARYKFSLDELKRQRESARTLLERLFDSARDWKGVLDYFDQLKGEDGRLIGWTKDELVRVLASIREAQIHDWLALAKSGNLYLWDFDKLKEALNTGDSVPKRYGVSMRQIAYWRAKKVRSEIEEKLDTIAIYVGRGANSRNEVLHKALDLIKFLAEEKRTLEKNPRRAATWKAVEVVAKEWIGIPKGHMRESPEYRAMLLCDIFALSRAGYITLDPKDMDELQRSIPGLAKRHRLHIEDLPKV